MWQTEHLHIWSLELRWIPLWQHFTYLYSLWLCQKLQTAGIISVPVLCIFCAFFNVICAFFWRKTYCKCKNQRANFLTSINYAMHICLYFCASSNKFCNIFCRVGPCPRGGWEWYPRRNHSANAGDPNLLWAASSAHEVGVLVIRTCGSVKQAV